MAFNHSVQQELACRQGPVVRGGYGDGSQGSTTSTIDEAFAMAPDVGIDILASHGPPKGILDRTVFGKRYANSAEMFRARLQSLSS